MVLTRLHPLLPRRRRRRRRRRTLARSPPRGGNHRFSRCLRLRLSLSLSLPLRRPHNFGVQLSRDFGAGRFIWSVLCFDEADVAVTYLLSVPVTDIGKRGRGLEGTSEIGDRGHAASGMLILKVNKQRDQCPFQKAKGCVNFTVKLGVRFGKACVGVG